VNHPDWQHKLVNRLAGLVPAAYSHGGEPASEPTAWAGLALLAHGRRNAAIKAARWLADQQADDGSIGVTSSRPAPSWPTSLAVLLWRAVDIETDSPQFADRIARGLKWSLAQQGETLPRNSLFGHDSTLVGWSWAPRTHSWLEPTAMFVLALKAVGQSQHPRTREAVRLLIDRQLPAGGCNYGNTIVLGQSLLPHVQPTGLAMMALAGEGYDDPRTAYSLSYLRREISAEMATASLCYGLMGLAAHDRRTPNDEGRLQHAWTRVDTHDRSPYKLALIAAAAAEELPLPGAAFVH
jgi:hypothetical protein